jgi:hypothetical protein
MAHTSSRDSDIWDSPVNSVPQPYQVRILGAGSKIKSSSHQIAHFYCSESLTSGTHMSATSMYIINIDSTRYLFKEADIEDPPESSIYEHYQYSICFLFREADIRDPPDCSVNEHYQYIYSL